MIKLLDYTKEPLTFMGDCATRCWDSSPSNTRSVAHDCIKSGHGRVMEFADVTMEIEGFSARAIRELYTHIAGTSRLQASTRYVNYRNMEYFTPSKIENDDVAVQIYDDAMEYLKLAYKQLEELGIPKEDIANILPLAMESKTILKINVRALLHFAELRLCNRAYHEIIHLTKEIQFALSTINDEWKAISEMMQPKCKVMGYCTEKACCGLMPKKGDVISG